MNQPVFDSIVDHYHPGLNFKGKNSVAFEMSSPKVAEPQLTVSWRQFIYMRDADDGNII